MTSPPPNPYLNRTAIKDDRDFFGRRRELAVLYSQLEAGQPQSVSVVGDYVPSGRNQVAEDFYRRHGFEPADGVPGRWTLNVRERSVTPPPWITLQVLVAHG